MPSSDIDARLNRLVGQIEGIRRMINGGRKAGDVVQQVMAARQALSKIGMIVLKEALVETASKSGGKSDVKNGGKNGSRKGSKTGEDSKNGEKAAKLLEKIFRV